MNGALQTARDIGLGSLGGIVGGLALAALLHSATLGSAGLTLLEVGLPTVAGAFFGAWAAFRLQVRHRAKEVATEQLITVREVQIAFATRLHVLIELKEQSLDRFRNDPDRHLRVLPMKGDLLVTEFPISKLFFLLGGKWTDIVSELARCEGLFKTTIETRNDRNELHGGMQMAYGPSSWPPSARSRDDLDRVALKTLKDTTDDLYRLCDQSIELCEKLSGQFRNVSRDLFPGEQVLSIRRADEAASSTPTASSPETPSPAA